MNAILEEKLNDVLIEAERHGAGAAHVVLHLLLSNYLNGRHHEFARHCCDFSSISLNLAGMVTPHDDPWDDPKYIN